MAIWQFDLSLVLRGGGLPRRTAEGHEVPGLAENKTDQAQSWLIQRFGAPWEMTEDWVVFGEEGGNRVDLISNEDGTSELSVRIDARVDSSAFIKAVCELSNLLGCVLFSAEFWRQINPEPSEVAEAAEASRAALYVRNPLHVLKGAVGDA